ncbi:Acetyltransferase (GNAT) domain-containing protein [Chryseobacterium arachidis]|uniref:Acetyltransferase (GNAT) domain-containing protein n=1 Tax=Chryseobacterium arachidis TaxID=1416778 RepID=A0A1M5M794_9FLAO|nr:GNAT family N-acetyltransferase [Chryseobacterium arachidis]SHG73151.1 Acetyltransferase (GNAT) domain-containing protein [Chryseobacterium arachidis]
MTVIYKKTTELSDAEIQNICDVFSEVFPEHSRSVASFKNEFLNTDFGYSFHGLLMDGEKIVGSQSYIPFVYLIDGSEKEAGLSVDTMIMKEYRNFDNIYDLLSKGHKLLKESGFSFVFGFPNDNAYPLLTKGLREKDIGDLSTYILPYKIGSIKEKLKSFNFISKIFSAAVIKFSLFSGNTETKEYRIQKNRTKFNDYRYKWFDGNYKKVNKKDFEFFYKIKKHQGVETAFLIDVHPLNKKNFDEAVRDVYQLEKKNFDIILYIGHLHFTPMSLIKIPKKNEPKTFHFTAKILDSKSITPEVLYDVNNWDVNLSNYDLL